MIHCATSEEVSEVSERYKRMCKWRASCPVLQSVFLVILAHSALHICMMQTCLPRILISNPRLLRLHQASILFESIDWVLATEMIVVYC